MTEQTLKDIDRAFKALQAIDDIRQEIQTDIDNVTNNSIYSRDDVDDGILIGLQMALDTVNKHIEERRE